jgi:hypothetical protein
MIIHRILEAISKNINDNDKKPEILQSIKEILKKKCNSQDAFFDIFKIIGNDIKNLYSSIGPYLNLAYSDNICCSLVWKVDKYIDVNGRPILVPSRCNKNRIDHSSLYCRKHNNPKSIQFCKLCSKSLEQNVHHEKNWEHFGNIFQFHLNPCFDENNIENCYKQTYSKMIDDLKCISYADFFIEQNKEKWLLCKSKEKIIIEDKHEIQFSTMQKLEKDIIIPKKKIKNTHDLQSQIKLPIEKNNYTFINLDDELRSILWCLLLNYIFQKNPKIEKSISTITIFDKENSSLYTNDKFIYNSNFKIEGILLDNDIAVFKDDIQNYVNSIDISKIDNKLIKVFIKEVLQ